MKRHLFPVEGPQESLIRILEQVRRPEDLAELVVAWRGGVPVTVGRLARVVPGHATSRKEASINGRPVIFSSTREIM